MNEPILPDNSNLFLASRNALFSYADLEAFSEFFLQYLIDYKYKFQNPIGFLSDSCDELIFCIAACWKLGIPFCCFSPETPDSYLKKQLGRLNPELVFTAKGQTDKLSAETNLPIDSLNLEKICSMDIEPGTKAKNYQPDLSEEQIFGYFFTSGTSSKPKIVPLKRRQLVTAANASAQNFKPRPNHFWLLCLPLNHIGGISIILRSLIYGSGIYRMDQFDVDMVTTFLSENRLFQAASLVPTMLKRLLDNPLFQTHNKFKAILLGGGPIHTDLLKQAIERGVPLVSSYGMTETCAQVAANPMLKPSGTYIPLKSVGPVFKQNSIEIRDENKQPLGINNSGNIWLKGPQVFDGYLTDQGLDRSSFDKKGWFNTGDFGHLNANGHLFIESRQSDIIISGGENISPDEVESALENLSAIQEAAVTGVKDPEWGEKVIAFLVLHTDTQLNEQDIKKALKGQLEPYKIPKVFRTVKALPRTENGKLQRKNLNDLLNQKETVN